MINAQQRRVVTELLSLPTAPFVEDAIIDHILAFCGRLKGVTVKRDAAGNILARYRHSAARVPRPVCLTAHMDHPGFIADRQIGKGTLRAHWRGGVRPAYFVGSKVRFFADGRWHRGVVRAIKTYADAGMQRVRTADVAISTAIPKGSPGMWDLPDPTIRGRRIRARACDDLAGAAAMLCCLQTLAKRRVRTDAYFLFTRAEEVGFIGAIAAAKLRTIPKRCCVVAVETSSQLPWAQIGDGPILRVGDKASVFTPAATAFCDIVAKALAKKDKSFVYQRKLMDGGTCESSAYCQLGYDATGLCVALGNYHNMDTQKRRIASEYIDTHDFANMVKWFVALTSGKHAYTGKDDALVKRLDGLEKQYATLLKGSA